jgi:stage II sporulation protein AA (anti-sigma F factor antagonist)
MANKIRRKKMSLIMKIENKMPGCYLVKLIGRLDGTTYADCDANMNSLLIPATKGIMFDMTNLDYISSMGLRIIIKTRKFIEGNGGDVHMINMQPQIEKVFKIANLLHGMTLFASVKEADDYFDAMQKKVLESLKQK